MTASVETREHDIPGVIILTPLLQEALRLGAKIILVEENRDSSAGDSPPSLGFIYSSVNEDKTKIPHLHYVNNNKLAFAVMIVRESKRIKGFLGYLENIKDKRVLVENLADAKLSKLVKPCDASRYFTNGRKRIKAKIFKRLGRWYNCPGYLLSLTFDPTQISRSDAWRQVGILRREFMNRVNRWRKRAGYSKAKFLSVIEAQPNTGYPHVHLVFPHLYWLAPIDWMTEQWGQAKNSVDYKVKDSISPVSYVCKYISKLDGWSELALSYIWANRTRLYSMSRDYVLPDYSNKRVPEWQFRRCMSKAQAVNLITKGLSGYDTLFGADDLVNEVLKSRLN